MCAGSICHIAIAVSDTYSIARNLYELNVCLPIQYPPTSPLSCEFSKAVLCYGCNNAKCYYFMFKLLGTEVTWSVANAGLQAATKPEA